jgi:hypothetical protein
MANRASIKANLTIRFVYDSDPTVATNYTAARTFEVTNANTVFSTASNNDLLTLSKAGASIGTMTSTAVADANIVIATVTQANSNFVAGNVLRVVASGAGTPANLRGRTYVQILPEVIAAT